MNRVVSSYSSRYAVKDQLTVSKFHFLKKKFLVRLLILGAFVVSLSLFYTWSRIQIVQIGYKINELSLDQQVLIDENKKLQMELSLMKGPERIKKYASEELNMFFPETQKIIEIQ